MSRDIIVDLFSGGGGASVALEAALGRPVDVAINHDAVAMAVHQANHPGTTHLEADVWEVKPKDATDGREVAVLWASPDCTHFSVAKGGVPRSQKIRSLAWVVVRWAKAVRPRVIFLENVQEFRGWGPLGPDGRPDKARMGQTFRRWCSTLRDLGYTVDWRVLDASQYGAPTRRRRLFMIARRDGQPIRWPEATHGRGLTPLRTAAECIDWSLPCPSIFERKKPLAEKTLWRIAQGIRRFVLESQAPFVVEMNHSNRPRAVGEPLGAVTTQGNRFNLVAPHVVQVNHGRREARCEQLEAPLSTVTATQRGHALVAPIMIQAGYGEREGQAARVLDLKPLDQPMPATAAQGNHIAEVRAFLTAFYGSDGAGKGQDLFGPVRTLTAKHRLGLVTVEGVDHQIVDIGMRMLEPHELLAAQFGRFASSYDLSLATTKAAKVRLIGNSVAPECAEALIRANLPAAAEVAACA